MTITTYGFGAPAPKVQHSVMAQPPVLILNSTPTVIPCTHSASVLSVLSGSESAMEEHQDSAEEDAGTLNDAEDWEDEIDDVVAGRINSIRDWNMLHAQIKAGLKKNSKILPLSHINQPMILSIFTTLCLKGVPHMQASVEITYQWHDGDGVHFAHWIHTLARHYQTFEQLPVECCVQSTVTHMVSKLTCTHFHNASHFLMIV